MACESIMRNGKVYINLQELITELKGRRGFPMRDFIKQSQKELDELKSGKRTKSKDPNDL